MSWCQGAGLAGVNWTRLGGILGGFKEQELRLSSERLPCPMHPFPCVFSQVSFLWHEMVKVFDSPAAVQDLTQATFFAYNHRRPRFVLLLLALGAPPNAQDERGNTLLHLCCGKAKPQVTFIQQLLKVQTRPAPTGDPQAPLALSMKFSRTLSTSAICLQGPWPRSRDAFEGRRPLVRSQKQLGRRLEGVAKCRLPNAVKPGTCGRPETAAGP